MYKVAFYPFTNKTNEYINIIKQCIEMQNIEVLDYEEAVKNNTIKEVDAVYLNWFEDVKLKNMGERIKSLLFFKRHNIKIVYVFHNKRSHDGKAQFIRKIFLDTMLRMADTIVVLSKASIEFLPFNCRAKAVCVPHPNYINSYSGEELPVQNKNDSGELKLLFVGAVRPYKNIELLISAFNIVCEKYDKISLTIAGKAIDRGYEEKILALIGENKRIKTDFRFIPDDEMAHLIGQHDILVLPYDIKSGLNSGTVMLAFSFARTVVASRIATIKEFDLDLTYSYEYRTEEEHGKMLCEQLEKVAHDYYCNPESISQKGFKLYQLVSENNGIESISLIYGEIFRK